MESFAFILFFYGIFIGSFLNVVIDRIPAGKDIVKGRSKCDHCKRNLSWYELIPLLSWILQGGKSRCCHKKLSIQYPFIEMITGLGFVIIYLLSAVNSDWIGVNCELCFISLISSLLLFCLFLIIFVIDLKTELICMQCIYGIIVLQIIHLVSLWYQTGDISTVFPFLLSAIGAAFFFFLLWFFSKGKAMGDGDIFLAFCIGLVLGYPNTIVALYVAFLTGAALGVILILRGKKSLKSHIPFGPFLIFGLGIAVLFEKNIMALVGKLL